MDRFACSVKSLIWALSILVACSSPTPPLTPTPSPAPYLTPYPMTCADLDAAWSAAQWQVVLQVLDQLEADGITCGDSPLEIKRYAAHINYALALENAGEIESASEQYLAALALNGHGPEALDGLARLQALPDPTPPACQPGELVSYTPPSVPPEAFVSAEGDQLTVNGQPFLIRGVNYYPRHAPWDRFLTAGAPDEIAEELDLITSAGFNALRIFLWYDPLFTCAPEYSVPNPETFARLDALVASARTRGLYLVVTLNDLPDLYFRPLYTGWARYDAQTRFIVQRYRDEPAVLAWDLRNEGDRDYGAHIEGGGHFEREVVLTWLVHTAELVRENDDHHLLTAGWWGDAIETADIVDILSFHHWTGAAELESRIATLREKSEKPILIEEVGYPSHGDHDEASQAQMLGEAIEKAEKSGAAGWLIWTAFDFTPANGQAATPELYFGIWRTDLTAKPALEVLPLAAAP